MRQLLREARVLLGAEDPDMVAKGDKGELTFLDIQKDRAKRMARLLKRYGATDADYKDSEDIPEFKHIQKRQNDVAGRRAWTSDR